MSDFMCWRQWVARDSQVIEAVNAKIAAVEFAKTREDGYIVACNAGGECSLFVVNCGDAEEVGR